MSRLNYHKCGIAEHFPIITKREESISHTCTDPGPSSYPSVKINISPVGSVCINFQFVFLPAKIVYRWYQAWWKGSVRCGAGQFVQIRRKFFNCARFYVAGMAWEKAETWYASVSLLMTPFVLFLWIVLKILIFSLCKIPPSKCREVR